MVLEWRFSYTCMYLYLYVSKCIRILLFMDFSCRLVCGISCLCSLLGPVITEEIKVKGHPHNMEVGFIKILLFSLLNLLLS